MDHKKNVRVYSLLGQRGTFGKVLKDLAEKNDRIIVLSADLIRTSGLEQFASLYPERAYNVGIAEENAVGMAAGLADHGFIPFVTTFANFAAMRANEFVRHFMAYMNCNVKLVGFGGGFAMEAFGTTHYGVEDMSVLRAMPNLSIFSPADGLEVAKVVEFAAQNEGPMYIRLTGKMNNPIIYKDDFDFVPGKMERLLQGDDVVIYATGSMVSVALKAGKALSEEGIGTTVYDVHTIKPIDDSTVIENKNKKLIITIEEHSIIGGLGSAVAEVLSEQNSHGRVIRIGTSDEYKPAGRYEYMLKEHGLTTETICYKIKSALSNSSKKE